MTARQTLSALFARIRLFYVEEEGFFLLVAALSTEAFVNVYVKCQDVVTAKPRYVSMAAVVGKTGKTSVLNFAE